jgi:hypothetical protein
VAPESGRLSVNDIGREDRGGRLRLYGGNGLDWNSWAGETVAVKWLGAGFWKWS